MNKQLREAIDYSPIITAVKDYDGLEKCISCEDTRIVFILFGDILTIADIVKKAKSAGKLVFVHMDLISGLQQKEIAVEFVKEHTLADGIISTKATLISKATELGLFSVMRFFVIDSMAYDNIAKQLKTTKPDIIEILPGPMPKVIKRICSVAKCPVIASGLISDKDDVVALLDAGASCISSSNTSIWDL